MGQISYGITMFLILLGIIYSFYQIFGRSSESFGFNPYFDYSRVYPGTFAFTQDFGMFDKSYYMYPDGIYMPPVGISNIRVSPGYRDYWYIGAHEYMKYAMGREYPYNARDFTFENVVPPNISSYCVQTLMRENGNLDEAIAVCQNPDQLITSINRG